MPPKILILPVWLVEPIVIEAKPSLKTVLAPMNNVPANEMLQTTAVELFAQEVVLIPMVRVAVKGINCRLPVRVLELICAPEVKLKLSA